MSDESEESQKETAGENSESNDPVATEGEEAQPAELPTLNPTSGEPADLKIAPLMGVNLKISVVLGRTVMSLGDLLRLGAGSVIELNTATGEPIEVLVNDKLFAKGEIVVVDESFGIRLLEIIDTQKPGAN